MESRNREDDVYWAVQAGDLRIDPQGRVWRHAIRRGNRWAPGTLVIPCRPRRAERLAHKYLQVRVMTNNVRSHALAHRLVWRHFVGPIPAGMTVNHKNGNHTDNRPSNLELATPSEQAIHALYVLHRGRMVNQHGVRNAMAKLTEREVAEIRARREVGELLTALAADFGVAMQTISKIARGDRRSLG